jgi:biotin transport system permease protein
MPAGSKLVGIIVISAFSCASVYGLAASVLIVLAASAVSRIPPPVLLKGSRPLVILSLCIIVLKTIRYGAGGITTPEIIIFNVYIPDLFIPFISKEGFFEGLFIAMRIFIPFTAAAFMFSVTTMRELRLSLALVEKYVIKVFSPGRGRRRGRSREHTPFFSLCISLMLGFIPRFFELWNDANLACDSRSCRRGLRRLPRLIPLVTERMMEAAANTAIELEARAFGCD